MFFIVGAMPAVMSDPIDSPDTHGTRIVNWDFTNKLDYLSDNITIEPNYVNLSTYESTWCQESLQDFNNATEVNSIELNSSGEVHLFLDTDIQVLTNGDFSNPLNGAAADNWTAEIVGPTFPAISSASRDDVNYWWELRFVDPSPLSPFNGTIWLNQSFLMPTIPKNINVSAVHRFILGDEAYEIVNGTNASIVLTNPYNENYTILERTLVNETDTDWVALSNEDTTFFNSTGNYNISITTFLESNTTSEQASELVDGVYNYWDNASILYDAYRPAGNFTSQVHDTGSYAQWNNISWVEELPTGTDIEVFVRTGNSSVPTDSIWSDWSAPITEPGGTQIDRPWSQYIQYRVEFSTLSTNVTPILKNLSITYEKYYLNGVIQTFDYLPTDITSWGFFSHGEELNGQTIEFQYSTDSGTHWTDMPLDGDLRSLDTSESIRIRGILTTSDTVITPSINWIQLSYVSAEPEFTIEPVWNNTGAEAGETIRLYVHFNNTADSSSSLVWLNVYLNDELEYLANNTETLSSFDSVISDNNPNIRKYIFASIPNSQNMFWIDALVSPGITDGTVLQTTVTLEYNDPLGNRVASMLERAEVRANSPVIAAELLALEDTADVGDSVHYQIEVNNTGHGVAKTVWLNTTLDDRLHPTQGTENISIQISNLDGQSSQMLYFNATLNDNVVQNSLVPTELEIDYADVTGFMRQVKSNEMTILARLESSIELSLITGTSSANSNEVFAVTIHYDNAGHGNADSINFNMTIPQGLDFETSSEECTVSGENCVWELEDVGPGPHSFTVTFRTIKMDQEFFNTDIQIFMQVEDPVEGILPTASSNIITVEIQRVYTFWETIYWPWSGFALAIASFFIIYGLWYYFKPEPPIIDDVFVTYKDGRLISHRKSSSGMREELDGDLVSAMLTAVQEFISDSLSKDRTDKVKKMEFGDRELFVERGENVHLTVIYSGSMNKKLEAQILELTQKIENDYPFLRAWDGRMSKLEDIEPQLDALIDEWQHLNGAVPEVITEEPDI